MSKITKVFVMVLVFTSILLNYRVSCSCKNMELFSSIFNKTGSSIQECGIKTRFKTNKNGQELYSNYISNISKQYKDYKDMSCKNKDNFCIEFWDENNKGYVEFSTNSGQNTISLQIIQKCNKNNLQALQEKVDELTKYTVDGEMKKWLYMKGKLNKKDDVQTANEKVTKFLSKDITKNIDTVKIRNGYSSSLYTGIYKPIKSGKEFIDLNVSLCSYSSGSYIIVGTPEIFVSY